MFPNAITVLLMTTVSETVTRVRHHVRALEGLPWWSHLWLHLGEKRRSYSQGMVWLLQRQDQTKTHQLEDAGSGRGTRNDDKLRDMIFPLLCGGRRRWASGARFGGKLCLYWFGFCWRVLNADKGGPMVVVINWNRCTGGPIGSNIDSGVIDLCR